MAALARIICLRAAKRCLPISDACRCHRVSVAAGLHGSHASPVRFQIRPVGTVAQTVSQDSIDQGTLQQLATWKYARTHMLGEVTNELVGREVLLSGWVSSRRQMGNMTFVVLRDREGSVQVIYEPPNPAAAGSDDLTDLSIESVVSLRGVVRRRPDAMVNAAMRSGQVEVVASEVHVVNRCDPLPFDLRSAKQPSEELRLRYRFLELRSAQLQRNLQLRSTAAHVARNLLHRRGFLEVETPTLFKWTVESGAKEFLVPSRQPGKFYALPQSPQQYKQILMASGVDKYYQLARCYRDEGGRGDRQPEFTQIDLEMAFIKPADIYKLVEELLAAIWLETLGVTVATPFPHLSYDDAIRRFGSDKPDTRYGFELHDVTDIVAAPPPAGDAPTDTDASVASGVGASAAADSSRRSGDITSATTTSSTGSVSVAGRVRTHVNNAEQRYKAICVKGLGSISAKDVESIAAEATAHHAEGFVAARVKAGGELRWPLKKLHLQAAQAAALLRELGAQEGDLILMCRGPHYEASSSLGRVRTFCASMLQSKGLLDLSGRYNFLWTVDFPLFTPDWLPSTTPGEPPKRVLSSTHHPFTAPFPEDAALLNSPQDDELLKIRALHYDAVVNGVEIGGGSIRIHDPAVQHRVFERLNLSHEMINQFGHLMSALRLGCPPHGGLAIGFDRLIAVLCNASNLREVIAFPKTSTGNELMTSSPSAVPAAALHEFGLQFTPTTAAS